MTRNVILAAALPAPPDQLYDMYLDSRLHSSFTGQEAKVESRAGSAFSAFDGMLSGKILHVEPKRMIVQTWRSGGWPQGAEDSVLILTFHAEAEGSRIELLHANVPVEDFAGISHGWEKYYWTPWRDYLTRATE
jgi:activator of HSP90 ATPase